MKKFLMMLLASSSIIAPFNGTKAQNITSWKEKNITLSTGVRLQYVEKGDPGRIPLILLHGLSDSWHSFETMLPHLPGNIRTFAISQRGHGNSERPSEGYSTQQFAADIAAFVKQKQLQQVIIAGHSMGGMIAIRFAIDYPELTRALVIIASDAVIKDNPGMPEFHQQVLEMDDHISHDFMQGFQAATLSHAIDSNYFSLLVKEGLKVPASVFKAALTGLMTEDLSSEISNIRVPALIIWGDQDAFFDQSGQLMMHDKITGSKLLIYKGSGHAIHWEDPLRCAKDISEFINALYK